MSDERIHELFNSIRASKEAYSTAVFLNIGKCLEELRALSPIKAPGAFYRWVTENTKMCRSDIVESIRCHRVYAPLFNSTEEMAGITPSLLRLLLSTVDGKKQWAPEEIGALLEEYKDLSITDVRKKLKEGRGETVEEKICTHDEIICKKCRQIIGKEAKKEIAFTGNEG